MTNIPSIYRYCFGIMILIFLFMDNTTHAQKAVSYDSSYYNALTFRSIGPFRGGRSAAVTGVPGQPMTFYFGGTGGGVWKTNDGGQTWGNISDGYFGGSVGAVAVSEWDPNVIYVGGGEKTVRGNVSHGYGVWKSLDGGESWKQMGLKDSRRIPRIRIHPKNPDLVYAAVLGHLFGPNEERGVYRSSDGGKTWERILFVNNEVGAVDLVMDPNNSRVLYASFWRILRTPYSLESGGEGSSLWKSTDGGDSWTEITRSEGLPQGTVGIIGVTVSPVNSNRIWTIIEAKNGGVFRSDDGGKKWIKVNEERKLRQRAWYYTRIYADTQNEDMVYVLNVRFWRSKDGGKTYERIGTPHGDHHDLWIDPDEPLRMAIADDGGGQVTVNGGESWTTYHNQPTAQFYRVTTDNHFPYRIYGAQQDNSTVRILHRTNGFGIGERDWEPTAGGESGHIAPHPDNPDIVYGGSYDGFLTRFDHSTGTNRIIDVWPDNPMGHGAEGMKYRFQWNFPIFFSPHDPNVLYTAGNHLFKTTSEGQNWEIISPDLTRNDPGKLGPSGGPITKDNTSVEYYCTIFAALESPHEAGVIWAGSDDGLIHITRDGGKNWENVTPPKKIMPEWMLINGIEAHPSEPGGLYVAGTRYKLDDFSPYLYKTLDYGKTWKKITNGIDPNHFTRAIRADPNQPGLLYAGTESGLYISFDDGTSWQSFQRNLPIVPITELALKENDLIVATQGRSFWVMDDLTPLHQLADAAAADNYWLYEPRPTYPFSGGTAEGSKTRGQNPPSGVMLHYYLKSAPDSNAIALKILDNDGKLIKKFTPKSKKESGADIPLKAGMNRFVWDMRYSDAKKFKGLILWWGQLQGPKAVPGTYQARLIVAGDSSTVPFEILADPRLDVSQEDMQAQFDFLSEIRDKLSEAHEGIEKIRKVRKQVKTVESRLEKDQGETIKSAGKAMLEKLKEIEETLYQTNNQSRQDPLNFPIRLNNKLATLASYMSIGSQRPTDQAVAVKNELTAMINAELVKLKDVLASDLPAYNQIVRDGNIPAVSVE